MNRAWCRAHEISTPVAAVKALTVSKLRYGARSAANCDWPFAHATRRAQKPRQAPSMNQQSGTNRVMNRAENGSLQETIASPPQLEGIRYDRQQRMCLPERCRC